jgi:hypothetical protein
VLRDAVRGRTRAPWRPSHRAQPPTADVCVDVVDVAAVVYLNDDDDDSGNYGSKV